MATIYSTKLLPTWQNEAVTSCVLLWIKGANLGWAWRDVGVGGGGGGGGGRMVPESI